MQRIHEAIVGATVGATGCSKCIHEVIIAKRATVDATVGATGCADGCSKSSGNVDQFSSAPHFCTTSQFDFVNTTFEGLQVEEEIEDDLLFLAAAAACVTKRRRRRRFQHQLR